MSSGRSYPRFLTVARCVNHLQFRVIVSCRFRITRATEVHAASSAASMSFGTAYSPTPSSFWAAALSAGVLGLVLLDTAPAAGSRSSGFAPRDRARRIGPVEPRRRRPRRPRARSARRRRGPPRRRSDRSAAPAPAAACSTAAARRCIPRASGRRRRAGSGAGTSGASRCRGRGDTGSRPCRSCHSRVGKVEERPVAGRLIRLDARPADLRRQQAADRQGVVAHHLGVEAEAVLPGQPDVGRVALAQLLRRHRRLPVGVRHHHQLQHVLHVPAAVDELDGQPVEQFGVASAATPACRNRRASGRSPGRTAASTAG